MRVTGTGLEGTSVLECCLRSLQGFRTYLLFSVSYPSKHTGTVVEELRIGRNTSITYSLLNVVMRFSRDYFNRIARSLSEVVPSKELLMKETKDFLIPTF